MSLSTTPRMRSSLFILAAVGLAAAPLFAQEGNKPQVKVLDKTAVPIANPQEAIKANNPNAPQAVAPAATIQQPQNALPNAFKFAKPSHDFGDIADTAPVEYEVEFTNISPETITFAVAASCGCTVASTEKTTLAPGESTKSKARFDPHGRQGMQTKTLTFTVTNPQGKYAQQTFNITSNVKALVTFDPPKLFSNEVDHRSGKKEKITVTGRKEGFKVEKVESSNDKITATIGDAKTVDVNGEKLTQVVIDLEIGKGAPIGTLNGQLSISTNDEKAKINPIYVGADIVGDVKCTPAQAILRVNTVSTPFETEVRLDSRSGSEFKITGIDIEARKDMSAVADVKAGPNNAYYLIKITGMTPADPGMHTGYVVVSTDAGGGESLRVPFTAAVAKPAGSQPSAAAQPAAQPIKANPMTVPPAMATPAGK